MEDLQANRSYWRIAFGIRILMLFPSSQSRGGAKREPDRAKPQYAKREPDRAKPQYAKREPDRAKPQ